MRRLEGVATGRGARSDPFDSSRLNPYINRTSGPAAPPPPWAIDEVHLAERLAALILNGLTATWSGKRVRHFPQD